MRQSDFCALMNEYINDLINNRPDGKKIQEVAFDELVKMCRAHSGDCIETLSQLFPSPPEVQGQNLVLIVCDETKRLNGYAIIVEKPLVSEYWNDKNNKAKPNPKQKFFYELAALWVDLNHSEGGENGIIHDLREKCLLGAENQGATDVFQENAAKNSRSDALERAERSLIKRGYTRTINGYPVLRHQKVLTLNFETDANYLFSIFKRICSSLDIEGRIDKFVDEAFKVLKDGRNDIRTSILDGRFLKCLLEQNAVLKESLYCFGPSSKRFRLESIMLRSDIDCWIKNEAKTFCMNDHTLLLDFSSFLEPLSKQASKKILSNWDYRTEPNWMDVFRDLKTKKSFRLCTQVKHYGVKAAHAF
jgi:hypothetical protein